jgi:hypothetical protein
MDPIENRFIRLKTLIHSKSDSFNSRLIRPMEDGLIRLKIEGGLIQVKANGSD